MTDEELQRKIVFAREKQKQLGDELEAKASLNSEGVSYSSMSKEDIHRRMAELKERQKNRKKTQPFGYAAAMREMEQREHAIKEEIEKFNSQFNKSEREDSVCCPRCGSTQLTANKKGFGLGKAAAGGLLLGPVGLLGGFLGSNKVIITCLKCGHQWKP